MIKSLLDIVPPPAMNEDGSAGYSSAVSQMPQESPGDTEGALAPVEAGGRSETPFRPTEAMCKVKARLFSRFEPSASATTPTQLTKASIVKLTGSSSVLDWDKRHPGFMNWLTSESWFDEKLEWLDFLTLNALEDILLNADPKAASAKLQAAKMIWEIKGRIKIKSGGGVESLDKSINSLKNIPDEDLVKIINVTKRMG